MQRHNRILFYPVPLNNGFQIMKNIEWSRFNTKAIRNKHASNNYTAISQVFNANVNRQIFVYVQTM